MFALLKVLGHLALPAALIAIGMAVGLALLRYRRRAAAWILAVTCGVFLILSLEPTAYFLAWSLERPYRTLTVAATTPRDLDAIILLGGGASKARGPFSGELGGPSWRRLWRAISLAQALDGSVPILYSGGSGDPFDPVSEEASLARSYAIAAGVVPGAFWVEDASRNTYENGVAVARMLTERQHTRTPFRIALVTSARHLRRAVAVFDRLGMVVVPVPADVATGSFHLDPLDLVPSATAFASSSASIHEWIGIAAYRLLRRM